MNENPLHEKIAEASQTILSYCMARTSNREDAEELSQDIPYELIRSSHTLRDDRAFYGFMWAIANNIPKQWYRKKSNRSTYELTDDIPDDVHHRDVARRPLRNSVQSVRMFVRRALVERSI